MTTFDYKVLAQSAPAATTFADIYTVPSAKSVVISTLVVANRALQDATYRIAVRVSGDPISNQHYLAYDVTVGGGDSTTLSLGLTLGATDVITVYASTGDLSFNVFGSEVTP